MPLITGRRRLPQRLPIGVLLALAPLLLLPYSATANTIALTPLIPSGTPSKRVMDIYQLMSSELEFMADVDAIQEINPPPSSLNTACLDDPRCLGKITSSARSDSLLTGVITDQGATVVLDLLYFEDGQIERRQAYTVPSDATALANQMTEILDQMLTGLDAAEEASNQASSSTFTSAMDDDEDDFFTSDPAPMPRSAPASTEADYSFDSALQDAGPTAEELAYQRRQQELERQAQLKAQQQAQLRAQQQAQLRAQQQAQQQAQLRAQQQAQLRAQQDAARRAQEEAVRQAQIQAQQEAARRAQEEAARQAQIQQAQQEAARQAQIQAQQEAARQAQIQQAQTQRPPQAAQAQGFNFSFASSADKIQAEDIDAAIQFGPAPTSPAAPYQAPAQPLAYQAPAQPPAYQAPAQQPAYQAPTQPPPYQAPAQQPAYGQQAAAAYGQQQRAPAYGQQAPPAYGQQQRAPAYGPQQAPAYGQQRATAYGQQAQQRSAYTQPPRPQPDQERRAQVSITDLDSDSDPRDRSKTGGKSRTSDAAVTRFQLSLRGGFAKYGAFDFISAGAEAGITLTKGVVVIGGVETFSVQRELPIERQTPGENIYVWNTIFPGNIGMIYQIDTGSIARPYVGADVIFAQYYQDEQGAEWAAGARARLGIDVMFSPNFGLNANIAMGMWTGKQWTNIDPGVNNSGLLPQFSGGIVVAF